MENKVKSVGEEFIEWACSTWNLKEIIEDSQPPAWNPEWEIHHGVGTRDILQSMADHINNTIEKRILEIHLSK